MTQLREGVSYSGLPDPSRPTRVGVPVVYPQLTQAVGIDWVQMATKLGENGVKNMKTNNQKLILGSKLESGSAALTHQCCSSRGCIGRSLPLP